MKLKRLVERKFASYETDDPIRLPSNEKQFIVDLLKQYSNENLQWETTKEYMQNGREPLRDVAKFLSKWLGLQGGTYQIHHIDFNPLNNSKGNLILVTDKVHNEIHKKALTSIANNLWKKYQQLYGTRYKDFDEDRFKSMVRQDTQGFIDEFNEKIYQYLGRYENNDQIVYLKNLTC